MTRTYLFIFLLLFFITSLFSQEDEFSSLVLEQESIQTMMKKLEDTFLRLAESLKEKEPENSKLLKAAFAKSKETLVSLQLDATIKQLKGKDLKKALDSQKKVINDLMQVMNALTNVDFSNQDEINRLEKLKKQIDALIKEQLALKKESEIIEKKDDAVKNLDAEIENLNKLIKNSEQTLQNSIEERAKGLQQASNTARELESQKNEVKRIFEKITGLPLEPAANQKNEEVLPQKTNSTIKDESQAGSQSLKSAHSNFSKAESKTIEGKSFDSEQMQKEAIKSLNEAVEELKKEKNRILSLPENYTDELAKKQQDAIKDLDKIKKLQDGNSQNVQQEELLPKEPSEDIPISEQPKEGQAHNKSAEKNDSQNSGDSKGRGEQQEQSSEQGQGEQQSNNDTKKGNNQKNEPKKSKNKKEMRPIEKADRYMHEAEKDLKNRKADTAKDNQEKVVEELKKVKEEIERALEQLRKEEKEEKLASLENRFAEILQRERIVQQQNLILDKAKGEWSRNESVKCISLLKEQVALKELVVRAEDILMEDATSVVFPDIVKDLKDDMHSIIELLREENTGTSSQFMIEEVIQTLEEIVESLQKAREDAKKDKENDDQSQPNQGNDKTKLISRTAELKLLRKLQMRINRMTKLLETETKNNPLPESKKRYKRIQDQQLQVLEMTRKMNENQ